MTKTIRVILLLLALPVIARAQTPVTQNTELSVSRIDSLISFFNNSNTTRLTGDARLPTGSPVGDVALLGGELSLAAHVTGSIVVINGSITFEPGARVDGDVVVIGGPVNRPENVTARSITLYRELLRYDLVDGVLVHRLDAPVDQLTAGRAFDFGRFDVIIAARGGYNRVEGLPVQIGPRLTLGHTNPTVLEGAIIARTADWDNPGFALRVEQFLGGWRSARIGFRWAEEVEVIEQWGFSDRENSLATFLIHEDYRDHFVREGWTGYFRLGRAGEPIDFTMAYSEFDVDDAVVQNPFTLFYSDHDWRDEPLVRNARFTTLNSSLVYDTRNDERDPAAGWLANVSVELELKGSERYRYGIIDVRRYARLSPNAKLTMRAVAAGSIKGDSLPTFRQQSLGGEASLPAYELHQFDCDAHSFRAYGCDRMALVQLEYQSNFSALSRITRRLGGDFGLLNNIRWVAFIDSGRAWTEEGETGLRSRGTSDFVTDAGIGLRFGVLGVYWAFPLSDRASDTNFFVRLGPRL